MKKFGTIVAILLTVLMIFGCASTMKPVDREAGVEYKVYKNTLMQRALSDLNIDISEHLNGPSALAYSADQIAPIKVLANFMKKHKAVTLKVGLVDNEVTTSDKLQVRSFRKVQRKFIFNL